MKFVVPYPYAETAQQLAENDRYIADSLNDGVHALDIDTSTFQDITVTRSGYLSNATINSAYIISATITSGIFTQGLYAGSATVQTLIVDHSSLGGDSVETIKYVTGQGGYLKFNQDTTQKFIVGYDDASNYGLAATIMSTPFKLGANNTPYLSIGPTGNLSEIIGSISTPTAIMLGNSGVDGGTIYWNSGTAANMQCDPTGQYLSLNGFYGMFIYGDDASEGQIRLNNFYSGATGSPLIFIKGRGTASAPLSVLDNDILGKLVVYTYGDDNALTPYSPAFLYWAAQGTIGSGIVPTDWIFHAGDGTVYAPEVLRLQGSTGDTIVSYNLKADHILEKTANHGVVIDGVTIKDNDISATSGSFTSGNFANGISAGSGTLQTLITPIATITSGNFNAAMFSGPITCNNVISGPTQITLDNGAANGGRINWNGASSVYDFVDANGLYRMWRGATVYRMHGPNDAGCFLDGYAADDDTANNGTWLRGFRTRGTLTTAAAVANNDLIMGLVPYGYDGDSYETGGKIVFEVDSAVTSSSLPMRIGFYTGDAFANLYERMRINAAGDIYSEQETLFSSTVTGWDTGFSQEVYTKRFGNLLLVNYAISGTSTNEFSRFTLPYSAAAVPSLQYHTPCAALNSGAGAAGAMASIGANQNIMNIYANQASGVWLSTGRKTAKGQFFLEVSL